MGYVYIVGQLRQDFKKKSNDELFFLVDSGQVRRWHLVEGFKVGKSVNYKQRIKSLQTGNPNRLILLNVFKTLCFDKLEKDLISFCQNNEIFESLAGEWFKVVGNSWLSVADCKLCMAEMLYIPFSGFTTVNYEFVNCNLTA